MKCANHDKLKLDISNQIRAFNDRFETLKNENDSAGMFEIVKEISKMLKYSGELKNLWILDSLRKSESFLLKFLISLNFRSVSDTKFPIYDVFVEYFPETVRVLENRSYVVAFGKNRSFNLGILSDGCPIEEPRVVQIPTCKKIVMSNFHTIFLTLDKQVYGCGKSQNFIVNKQDLSYTPQPKIIEIGEESEFLDVAVTDKFTVLVSKRFVYFIGQCSYAFSSRGAKSIDQNCVQIPYSVNTKLKHVYAYEKSTVLEFETDDVRYRLTEIYGQFVSPDFKLGAQKCIVRLKESIELLLSLENEIILYQLPDSNLPLPLEIMINLKSKSDIRPKQFFVKPGTNEIIVQCENGIIAKGHLEFLKLEEDEFLTSRKGKGIMDVLMRYQLIAILSEIPGTFGSNVFCASPDLNNILIQVGNHDENEEKSLAEQLTIESQSLSKNRISRLIEKQIKNVIWEDELKLEDVRLKFRAIEEELCRRIMEFEDTTIEDIKYLIEFLNNIGEEALDFIEQFNFPFDQLIEKLKLYEPDSEIDFEDDLDILDESERKSAILRINAARKNDNLNDIELRRDRSLRNMHDVISLSNAFRVTVGIERFEATKEVLHLFEIFMGIIRSLMNGEKEIGFEFEKKLPRRKFESENIIEIFQKRIEEGDLDEFDIPMDISIISAEHNLKETANSIILSMIYPKAMEFLINGKIEIDGNSDLYQYLFNRSRSGLEIEHRASNSSEEDVVIFLTSDGKSVQIHRYLVLIHSRHISAMLRFTYTQYGIESSSSSSQKIEVKTSSTSKTVRDSLAALKDIRTLFNRNMNELIEILFFFDYFMMFEAVQDTLDVIFLTANPQNSSYLLQLYENFPEDTLERFLKYPYFLFQTKCELTNELVLEFSKNAKKHQKIVPNMILYNLDEQSFIERFIGNDGDVEKNIEKRRRRYSSKNNSVSESPRSENLNVVTPTKTEPIPIAKPSSPIPIYSESPSFSEEFPESPSCSLSTPLTKHRSGGRFSTKGSRFKKANEILSSPEPANPWKTTQNSFEPVVEEVQRFEDVVKEEEKFTKMRKGEMKKIRHLPHIEMEDQAVVEILRTFQMQCELEACVTVELVSDFEENVENEPMWGIMPGLLKR
ncbi:unnamed protein product [Caenorhabditis angaria]|uniref:BTB domain-containing protein n=1 Tax=Caenorhabditis angaria TaxID=860376 RepID=A0A9P1I3C1_9PELO|nr:unnamed protein product [Caenorhabditis angaria]